MKILFTVFFVFSSYLFSFSQGIDIIYQSPQSGAINCTREETIIFSVFKEIDPTSINNSLVNVIGSKSGSHSGTLFLATDNQTLIFRPNQNFDYNENINVSINTGIRTTNNSLLNTRSFSFSTRKERTTNDFVNFNSLETRIPYSKFDFKIFNLELFPDNPSTEPGLNIINSSNPSYGRIFISGFRGDTIQFTPYLTIYDNSGNLLFSKSTVGPSVDFKKQKNGYYSYCSLVSNKFYILDPNFNMVDSVECGNGYTTDLHELLILDNGNMLIMSYDSVEIDMSQIVPNGHPNALVTGLVIQELDKNKNVVYQWRSWEEMEITDTDREDLTAAKIDYAHGNSIEPDWEGNLIISSRHLSEITKLNRRTGKIMWRFGGKKNQFTYLNDNIPFSYQHDARRVAHKRILLFDNGNYHSPPYSRAVEYELDEVNLTAKLVWEFDYNKEVVGFAMGNAQRLPNGNTFIGWGFTQPNATEVTPLGTIVHEVSLDPGFVSYRAFKFTYDQPESQYPSTFVLNQNYPNPFNPSTVITFNIPVQSKIT